MDRNRCCIRGSLIRLRASNILFITPAASFRRLVKSSTSPTVMDLLTHSFSSTTTTTMRKRPRTPPMLLDLPCTSALTSTAPSPTTDELVSRTTELFATRHPVDDALAELDVFLGLGLRCGVTNSQPFSLPKPCLTIEEELEAAFKAVRNQRDREVSLDDVPDDTSCVSGSGGLGLAAAAIIAESSTPNDVLRELQDLESRTSISVMSPPLHKPSFKRRHRHPRFQCDGRRR